MDEKRAEYLAGVENSQESERLFAGFSHVSSIGFAILDRQLRYVAINDTLAAINRLPVEAHLGKSITDVLGAVASRVEPTYRRVFTTGQPVLQAALNATWPTRSEPGCWIRNYVPIKDKAGAVKQVGVLVLEVTDLRKLEEVFLRGVGELRHTRNNRWLARELHDSINLYHAALAITVSHLVGKRWQPGTSELLAQSIEPLDERILQMRTLVSAVASRFPTVK